MKHQVGRISKLLLRGEWPFIFEGIQYVRKGLPLKGRLNILAQGVSPRVRIPLAFGLPTTMTIEPASVCNLKCPLCPSGLNRTVRKPAWLEFSVFKSLIDELGHNLIMLQLWEWGEPFLNPDFCKMISYAKTRGIITITSTNGHCFQSDQSAQALVTSGLDCLICAVDGTTQEAYEKYRVGGKLDQVIDGLARLVAAKKANGAKGPIINLRMVVNAYNERQTDDFKALGKDLGVDVVSFKTLNPGMCEVEDDFSFLPDNRHLRRDVDKHGMADYKCTKPWCTPTLFSDGSILLCAMDVYGTQSLGKLSPGTSFKKIWNSKGARDFRENIRRDPNHYDFCRNCGCREPDFAVAFNDFTWFTK